MMDEKCMFVSAKNNDTAMNTTYLYSYEIKNCESEDIEIELSTSYTYKFYFNGEFIAAGPTRAPKGYYRADKYTLKLKKGRNVFSVLTCDYAINTYCYVMQKEFFYCNAISKSFRFTAKDFTCYLFDKKIKKVNKFSIQRGFTEHYRLDKDLIEILENPKDNLHDIEIEIISPLKRLERRVAYAIYERENETTALYSGKVMMDKTLPIFNPEYIYNVSDKWLGYKYDELVECISDTVSQFKYERNICGAFLQNEYVVYDFKRILSGFLGLEIECEEDAEIYLIGEEAITDDLTVDFSRGSCAFAFKWAVKKGKYCLETLEPYTLKYMQVIVLKGRVKVTCAYVRKWENPDAYNLVLKTQDEELKCIFKAAQNTLAQNSTDLLTDCPSRERSGWINDMFYSIPSAECLMQNNSVVLNSLENYLYAKDVGGISNDVIPMCYPADHLNHKYIPNSCFWFIVNVCRYISQYNDETLKEIAKEKIYKTLNYFKKYENEFGLLEELDGWIFIEWSKAAEYVNGVNFPSNMQYYQAIRIIAETYADNALYKKAEVLKHKIIELSFNGEFFEDNVVRVDGKLVRTNNVSEVCQYFAYITGIAHGTRFSGFIKKLVDVFVPNRANDVYPEIEKANVIIGLLSRETMLYENGYYNQMLQEILR